MAIATFAAGCFWGVEVAFRQVEGVIEVAVGYMGGHVEQPTYEQVCTDETGHAEVAQVEYDPQQVSYEALLDVFWSCHDPTQRNRQGLDVGSQYRSVIFFHSEEQRKAAEMAKRELQERGIYDRPIVTAIEPAQTFYRAEEYPQRYFEKRGLAPCCAFH